MKDPRFSSTWRPERMRSSTFGSANTRGIVFNVVPLSESVQLQSVVSTLPSHLVESSEDGTLLFSSAPLERVACARSTMNRTRPISKPSPRLDRMAMAIVYSVFFLTGVSVVLRELYCPCWPSTGVWEIAGPGSSSSAFRSGRAAARCWQEDHYPVS